ncbi:FK506 binding protein [Aureococcus anophagefferens]|nr:FK506 binding protein [Aureococcus anophagefferens]
MAPGPPATWSACGRAGAGAAGYGEAPDDGIARPEGAARPSAAPAPAEARADAMSGGMMDAKIDGTPFGVLMQQAVKLKTHVHKVDRVKFDRWPKFYQNTAFIKDDQKAERAIEDFDARMAVAQRYKAAADAHLRGGDPMQAGMHYEWAAGLFRWATTLDDNWRKKSLDDEDILEESYDGDTPARREAIDAFKLACYLNIARAYFKQREWTTARQACDWALRLDGSSDKALFLRATIRRARVPRSTERDDAIVDLEQAETLLVAATAAAAARDDLDDAACERLVGDLGKRKKQLGKAQDKAYGGMFDRGEVYDGDETARRRLADAEDAKALPDDHSKPLAPGDGTFSSTPGPEAELAAAEKAMRDDAKARGIDLDDPAVVDMLEELQREQRETATPEGRERRDVREAAKAKASAMSMRDLIRSLKALGVPHGHCDTKGELKDLYVLACVDVDEAKAAAAAGAAAPPAAAPSTRGSSRSSSRRSSSTASGRRTPGPSAARRRATRRAPRRPQPYLDADEPDFAARDWTDEF